MSREPFEAMPDVMDAKQLAEALQISKAGTYNLLSSPDFPTLRIGGRKWEKSMKIRRFYENKVQTHNTDLKKRLTAPYSEERRRAASAYARQNGFK